ncbi:MAG: hypothetical protein M0R66_00420 [Candidatus Omnitrophica bacterium]|nr:hypothetical protein [Candidatus Omnitrophota bacterium]
MDTIYDAADAYWGAMGDDRATRVPSALKYDALVRELIDARAAIHCAQCDLDERAIDVDAAESRARITRAMRLASDAARYIDASDACATAFANTFRASAPEFARMFDACVARKRTSLISLPSALDSVRLDARDGDGAKPGAIA